MKQFLTLSILGILLASCGTNFYNEDDLRNNYVSETAFSEMTSMSNQAIEGSMAFFQGAGNCATITLDTLNAAKSITIDYGPTDCLCDDGKRRRGMIVTTFTGSYSQIGTVITHTPSNYYVNDYKVEGTKVVTNSGADINGAPVFSVSINGSVTDPDGKVFTYTSNRTRVWKAGSSTPLDFFDDEYEISGNASGTNEDGSSYSISTITPIYYKIGCKWPTKGILDIDLSSLKSNIQVVYGNGACDMSFSVLFKAKTYNFNF